MKHTSMVDRSSLPRPVAAFIAATECKDSAALYATLAPSFVLRDMNEEHRGSEIREWNERLFIGANVSATILNIAHRGNETIVSVTVDGDYASAGVTEPFQLDWHFALEGDSIASLAMIEEKEPHLPDPVYSFVMATNTFDLDAFVAVFEDDAIVNDNRYEYLGADRIRAWAAREMIGDSVTMFVTKAFERHGNVVLEAKMDGAYDKSNLPDPMMLSFYFTLSGTKISQMVVIHNRPQSEASNA